MLTSLAILGDTSFETSSGGIDDEHSAVSLDTFEYNVRSEATCTCDTGQLVIRAAFSRELGAEEAPKHTYADRGHDAIWVYENDSY